MTVKLDLETAEALAHKFKVLKDATSHGYSKYVNLVFTDLLGRENQITVASSVLADEHFYLGQKVVDGSSFQGWKSIENSDLRLLPNLDDVTKFVSAVDGVTLVFPHDRVPDIRCNLVDPVTEELYSKCPRSVAKRAEEYLAKSNVADAIFTGVELEFFVFDSVQHEVTGHTSFYKVSDTELLHNSAKEGDLGFRPRSHGGYAPVQPLDNSYKLREAICDKLTEAGLVVEAHHHEVASAQNEIATRYNTLLNKADEVQLFKKVTRNVVADHGKTITFMPKPIWKDNGSGMHVHLSLVKDGVNLFSGDGYAGLSEDAIYFIGGVLKHAKALNAFTNPSTNSYKRLVPGFEAPVILAYSERNRSAAIRIPTVNNDKAKRIEVRFPDCTANPYLALSAILMAGIDGIKNKVHPGAAQDRNLYELTLAELKEFDNVAFSLEEALDALEADHDFLLDGGVFTKEIIDSYLEVKREEVGLVRQVPTPVEFELYYNC